MVVGETCGDDVGCAVGGGVGCGVGCFVGFLVGCFVGDKSESSISSCGSAPPPSHSLLAKSTSPESLVDSMNVAYPRSQEGGFGPSPLAPFNRAFTAAVTST